MMIDGYDLIDGDRVLVTASPNRWQRFVYMARRALGMRDSLKGTNGVYTVSFGQDPFRREPKWLKPTRLNRAFVWLLAVFGDHRYGILYDFGD